MNIKKPLLIAGVVSGLGLAGVGTLGVASAASSNTSGSGDNLVDKIASTFNLDKSKVQAVFDSNRQEKEAERQAQLEKELTQLVSDGKITATQKDAILTKQKELKAARESNKDDLKNKTESERKTFMDQQRSALEQWTKDNNIPTEYLRYVMGGGRGHGHGGPGKDAPMGQSSSSSAVQTN
jgi:hypothetical protein